MAVGSKTGHLFLFERLTGRPFFPTQERPVPASDVPGEHAAATQPFPDRPASLVPQQITEADIWGATAQDRDACLATFRTLRHEGAFTPPSVRGSLVAPGNVGGLHWGGMAWDASTRTIIAPVNRLPAIVRLVPKADFERTRRANPALEITEQRGTPFAMSRQFFLAPSGIPCVAPPWGELVAIHADTERRPGGRRWGTCAPPSVSRPDRRPDPSTWAVPSSRPRVSSSSARPSIRISERSRRRAAARCGRVASDRRASNASPVHHGTRTRDDRDRRRRLRFTAVEARLDARGLRSARSMMVRRSDRPRSGHGPAQ